MPLLPAILETVRKDALADLRTRIDAMCAAVDDTFFDRSEKAPADEQSAYFDAMREFRLKRQGLVEQMLTGIDDAFLRAAGEAAAAKPASMFSLDGLSLLSDDDLDVSVAFQGMLARCRDVVSTLVDHLRQRFILVSGHELEVESIPLHPEVICEQFKRAIEPLTLPIKARLIIYKMFERHVLENLRDILIEANATLAGAGYLPEIKVPKIKHSSSSSRASKSAAAEDDNTDDGGSGGGGNGNASHAIGELMALMRAGFMGGGMPGSSGGGGWVGGEGGAGGNAGGMPVPAGPPIAWNQLPPGQMPVMYGNQAMVNGQVVQSDVPIQVMAPLDLSTLLTQLQRLQQLPQSPAGQSAQGIVIDHTPLQAVDVQGELSGLLHDDAASSPRALAGVDKEVIDLVSMLFDFILDDAELPAEMKALIGRLQIPLLKVSLLDKTFFERDNHPARTLVNALARAGIGWTREGDDGLYARVESAVHTVLTEFTDDTRIFVRLNNDLTAFLAERDKRLQMTDARLRDKEEGQARTAVAQTHVRAAVSSRIAGKSLLPEVITVIQDAWQRVLYLTAIREGTDSEIWQQRLKILDVLVWCAARYEKEELRARQRGLVPRLLVSLRKGMEAVNFDQVSADSLLANLQPALEKLGTGGAVRTVRVVAEQQKSSPGEVLQTASVQAVQVLRSSESEVVIAAPAPQPPAVAAADERWLQTAESLAPGTWVEFHESENNFTVRGKIAARIRAQNKFIFVNGRGVKIAEKSVEQLARDLQLGTARLISDAALFDRALESMISRLKTDTAG